MTTRNASRVSVAVLLAGLALSATACLEKETHSTIYVEADGSVTWTIVETRVCSDKNGDEATREEEEYLETYLSGAAAVPLALAAAGGEDVRSEVLRARVPFTTRASARFTSLDVLARSYCAAARLGCETDTRRDGGRVTWRWTLQSPAESRAGSSVDALDAALAGLHVVFAAARPVAAAGFRIDGREAVLDLPEGEDGEEVSLGLTWETGGSGGQR